MTFKVSTNSSNRGDPILEKHHDISIRYSDKFYVHTACDSNISQNISEVSGIIWAQLNL